MFMIDRHRIEHMIFPFVLEAVFKSNFEDDEELEDILNRVSTKVELALSNLKNAHRIKLERRADRIKEKVEKLTDTWGKKHLNILALSILARNLQAKDRIYIGDYHDLDAVFSEISEILDQYIKKHKSVLKQLNLAIFTVNNFLLEFINDRYFSELTEDNGSF